MVSTFYVGMRIREISYFVQVRLPPIKFACLGPEDHYFVKFVNGKMEWVAKDSFQGAMRSGIEEHGLYVDRVSLGPSGTSLAVMSIVLLCRFVGDFMVEWDSTL